MKKKQFERCCFLTRTLSQIIFFSICAIPLASHASDFFEKWWHPDDRFGKEVFFHVPVDVNQSGEIISTGLCRFQTPISHQLSYGTLSYGTLSETGQCYDFNGSLVESSFDFLGGINQKDYVRAAQAKGMEGNFFCFYQKSGALLLGVTGVETGQCHPIEPLEVEESQRSQKEYMPTTDTYVYPKRIGRSVKDQVDPVDRPDPLPIIVGTLTTAIGAAIVINVSICCCIYHGVFWRQGYGKLPQY